MTERSARKPAVERKPLRLAILALDGCMLSSVAGPIDALRVAQKLAEIRQPLAPSLFEPRVVSVRGASRVRTSSGLDLDGVGVPGKEIDIVLVPGVMHSSPGELAARLGALQPEIEWLRDMHLRGVRIAASCSGTFLLAATGLLDGHRATTSWWLAAAMRQTFPDVVLQSDQMLVEDGKLITTGGATAIYQLILRLIAETGGDELAQQTARMLVIDAERQSQAPYVSEALMQRPRNSLSERADRVLQESLDGQISVSRLALQLNTSERSLLRHFREQYGESPIAHIQRLRVERAKALLEASRLSFEEIVERCGYSDVSSFRKLFKRATTLTPMDYRERFRLRAR
jgi:transcriptional regulator GlxA family with amidase domain